jgi:hypothetical protein
MEDHPEGAWPLQVGRLEGADDVSGINASPPVRRRPVHAVATQSRLIRSCTNALGRQAFLLIRLLALAVGRQALSY